MIFFEKLTDVEENKLKTLWQKRNYNQIQKFIIEHGLLSGCSTCLFDMKEIAYELHYRFEAQRKNDY